MVREKGEKVNTLKRISKVFESAEEIVFDDSSKLVLMSDCHRGDGNWSDDFSKNQNLYFAALTHYFKEDYTYIEIGDGDEIWENKRFSDIRKVHSDVFEILSKFFKEDRLKFIFGNHDIVKKDPGFVKSNLQKYFDERKKKYVPLFENIRLHEGLIFRYKSTNDKIFLIHGHQVDYLNDTMWRFTRFLVRYLWRPLNLFGFSDPTRTAENYQKKQAVEKKLIEWVTREKQMLIAGHTHRPVFPEIGEPPYFNDGSCVHPRCITAMEICNGHIKLVKWFVNTKEDGTLFIDRAALAGPRKLKDYFDSQKQTK